MARSTWVAHAFEWGKLLKCHLKRKTSRKLANGQNIEKENGPRASSAPALGLNTMIFQHVYWYMQQISGERLQDHWFLWFYGLVLNFCAVSTLCMFSYFWLCLGRRNISIGIPLDLSIPFHVTREERGHEVYRSVG